MRMIHLLPKEDSDYSEVMFFGKDESEIQANDDFKSFLEDYDVKGVYEIELIEGTEILPSYIESHRG